MKEIYIHHEDWEQCGADEFPAARLLYSALLVCFGPDGEEDRVPCHVEAIAVVDQLVEGEDGPKLMVAAHDDFQNALDAVVEIAGERRPQTVKIGPHDYVLSITPFG
jgi:hypothetical protein